MLDTMTAAGKGMGRTQPGNVLDELLPLPSKTGKGTRRLPTNDGDTGISSFEQMLTEDLQSRKAAPGQSSPISEANALPQVAEKDDKAAVDPTAKLTTARDAQLPQPATDKDVRVKEDGRPADGKIDPSIINSLFTAVPFIPGAVTTASEGKDDKLPASDAAAELLLDKVIEKITNQAAASAAISVQPEETPVADKPTAELPSEAARGREAISLTGLQRPTQLADKPENGAPMTRMTGTAPMSFTAAENITNQAAAASAALSARPEKAPGSDRLTAEPPVKASSEGDAILTKNIRESLAKAGAAEFVAPKGDAKMTGSTSTSPTVENISNQAAAASAAISARQEKAPGSDRLTAEPPVKASSEGDAILIKNIRESLAKAGVAEFVVTKGDAKKDSVPGDKGKSHPQELFTASDTPDTMGINVNRAGVSLGKGQDTAVPTGPLLEQVAEQLPQAISKGSGRVRLSLVPENLGKLDMDLVVRENRVQIILTAENRSVQQTLQGHVEQLKDALQQQGLKVDGFSVLLQNGRQGPGDTGGNPFWNEYNRSPADKKGTGDDDFPAAITPFPAGQNLKNEADGINIFA